jgi:hypothetical protein
MDFETFADTTLRRADSMLGLARRHPERFALHEVPPKERVPMWKKKQFFDYLSDHTEHFEPGDIVMIRGYTSFEKRWETRVMHYHSFFVYEVDPVSGVPVALVGNPGRPSIRTWFFEGLRTPKRSVWYSVGAQWLESIIADDHAGGGDRPTLRSNRHLKPRSCASSRALRQLPPA